MLKNIRFSILQQQSLEKKRTVIVRKFSYAIKKLKRGKTYYVRVRGINRVKAGKWSAVKKVSIK